MHTMRMKLLVAMVAVVSAALFAAPGFAFAETEGLSAPLAAAATGDVADSDAAADSIPKSDKPSVSYRVFLQDNNQWSTWKANGKNVGKLGKRTRVQGLALAVDPGKFTGSIAYRVRAQNGPWSRWKMNGATAGAKAGVEAVQVRLTKSLARKYDVVYRVNVRGVGWQKRVRNGETAGVTAKGQSIRAIKVLLVPKEKRTGWVEDGGAWHYLKDGVPLANQWISTNESPVNEMLGTSAGAKSYWLDVQGNLALDRMIVPKSEQDSKAGHRAYATADGTLLVDTMRMFDGKWYTADINGVLRKAKTKRAALIQRYVDWALAIAGDSSHGYSQYDRWGPDYDCSSFVVAALKSTGFQVGDAVWTGNMQSELTQYGFTWCTDFSKLNKGDIMLVHNDSRQHTEIYIGNGKTVGAHIAETGTIYGKPGDQTGNEISVAPYRSIWEGYLRYTGKR